MTGASCAKVWRKQQHERLNFSATGRAQELQKYRGLRCPAWALMFLVGPNGAGKSNFLDALRFVADALRTSLDHALRDRGGINDVRRRSGGHPTHFGMRLNFVLRKGESGHYAFRIGSQRGGGYEVQQEECFFNELGGRHFRVENGELTSISINTAPAVSSDRLYLVNVSGLPEFRPVYDAFSNIGFYSLNPDRIRDLQPPDSGRLSGRDGSNLASVLAQLEAENPAIKRRIEEYLGKIVPGIRRVDHRVLGPKETLDSDKMSRVLSSPGGFWPPICQTERCER